MTDAQPAAVEEPELSPAAISEAAAFLRDLYRDQQFAVVHEVGELSRWLSASLLAVNGGALVAIGSNWEKFGDPVVPAGLLLAGVVTALLSGVANQFFYTRALPIVLGLVGHTIRVHATGIWDEAAREAIEGADAKLRSPLRWTGPVSGWISGILFIVDAVGIGMSAAHTRPAETH